MNILNPIFDSSFKYLMEDDKSARILLSALLKNKVVQLEPRPQEYLDKIEKGKVNDLNVYRLDYIAKVALENGQEEDVCIELQKVWLKSELMRFRRYIAGQYSDETNLCQEGETPMHIVAIYLLGHKIAESNEPIIYCRGGMMTDFNGNPIVDSGKGKFIRSVTHDVIIVQIPCLEPKPRNATERILSVFDQRNICPSNRRIIDIPEPTTDQDLGTLTNRLMRGAAESSMLRKLEIEDEIYSEFEYRDLKTEEYRAKNEVLEAENSSMKQEMKKREEEMKKQADTIRNAVLALANAGLPAAAIAQTLNLDPHTVENMLE